eukprot:gene17041-17231_t
MRGGASRPSERAEQARFDSDRCQFGDRFFIRCILTVGIPGSDASYGWGAWAEVELAVFMRYLELYDADGSTEPMHPGRLANALWPYPCSLGEQVWIQFRDATSRPELYLPKDAESLLAKEQREGMDAARYHQILEGRGR